MMNLRKRGDMAMAMMAKSQMNKRSRPRALNKDFLTILMNFSVIVLPKNIFQLENLCYKKNAQCIFLLNHFNWDASTV